MSWEGERENWMSWLCLAIVVAGVVAWGCAKWHNDARVASALEELVTAAKAEQGCK